MNKPRKQTYTMDMYLNKIKDQDIRNDSNTQRRFVWNNEQVNELIVTVLTDDYIPPIILGEEDNAQLWIVDGGQRSASLNKFRFGNYKITSAVENSIIPYKSKTRGDDGKIAWIDATFDIKNKTYDKLPEELKKKFNEYQVETVIHEGCDLHRISQLIKRYNNHTSMNTNQKAFTYIDKYAKEVRDILDDRFFLDCGMYTEKERTKGVLERVVLESIMCMFHFNQWKKQTKQIATYLNCNGTKEEFDKFNINLCQLREVITDDIKDLFTSKDSFIWFTLFNKFVDLGFTAEDFANFLRAFKAELKYKIVDGVSFEELNKNRGTKDKSLITDKLNLLEKLACSFFDIEKDSFGFVDVLSFVQENVNQDISEDDVEFYNDILKDLAKNNDCNKLFCKKNKPSLIAIVAYACQKDLDLDNWKNFKFSLNQKENYIYMRDDLDDYVRSVA